MCQECIPQSTVNLLFATRLLVCGTAFRRIFAKSKILRSSGGLSTHGVASCKCSMCKSLSVLFCFCLYKFCFPILLFTCSALLNFYFAFYFQFALLLQISHLFFVKIILFNLLGQNKKHIFSYTLIPILIRSVMVIVDYISV